MSERVRTTIPIIGINTSESCHTVQDGSMEDMHNLRFRNGAFVNVCEPIITAPITDYAGYKIMYKMECLGGNEYIALRDLSLHIVVIANGVVTAKNTIGAIGSADNLKLSHFGSVLYANYDISGELNENVWIYKDGAFSPFDIGAIDPPKFSVEIEHKCIKHNSPPAIALLEILNYNVSAKTKDFLYAQVMQEVEGKGFVFGGYFVALAYKFTDGNIVKCSDMVYISSNVGMLSAQKYNGSDTTTYAAQLVTGIKAKINLYPVDLPEMIKSVVVLTSRVQRLHDIDSIYEKFGSHGTLTGGYCGSNCLVNKSALDLDQPMYELCDVDFRSEKTITIDREKINDVEHNAIYKSSFSNHTLISRGKFEYNNRLHMFDLRTTMFSDITPVRVEITNTGDSLYPVMGGSSDGSIDGGYVYSGEETISAEMIIEVDNQTYKLTKSFIANTYNHKTKPGLFVSTNNLVTYPDTRMISLKLYVRLWEQQTAHTGRYLVYVYNRPIIKAFSNNMSYCFMETIDYTTNNVYTNAYLQIRGGVFYGEALPIDDFSNKCFVQKNKLHVSGMNNPFYVAPANIYTIGSTGSEIECINTATEQITETKFGLFPLYVFTNRSITALEVGQGEVLYDRVVEVSGEIILKNTTTIGAMNYVFFVAEQGVMAIEGRKVICVSRPLDEHSNGKEQAFRKYCAKAQLSYNPVENELIVYNNSYSYAYTYNLTEQYWSRRDWSGLNIGSQQEMLIQSKGIAKSWLENSVKPLAKCSLISRAIKLGSLEFKRLETLIARLSIGGSSAYVIYLDGSNDLKSWAQLAKIENNTVIRRTGASCKYFRVRADCNVRDYLAITGFDAEHYLRFVNRLR